ISVLSALEGMKQIAPSLQTYVLPASVVVLFALFAVQPLGTGKIGRAFGPIMLAWFAVMAVLRGYGITQHLCVLAPINPFYGIKYLANVMVPCQSGRGRPGVSRCGFCVFHSQCYKGIGGRLCAVVVGCGRLRCHVDLAPGHERGPRAGLGRSSAIEKV